MINNLTLEELLKSQKISQRTYDKAKIAKQIIERKYNLLFIKNTEWNYILEKINSLDLNEEEKDKIKQEIISQESSKYRFFREKQTIRDYESIAIIGRGAFGEVHVCRHKETGDIVAIKKIKKDVLITKNQVIHVRNEQLFMSKVKSPWIVELKASFQEDDYLYLVMEYLPGGDLMNLFIKKDILTEEESRFYIAELILSIESIHELDCIHRDIKPDNILIDKNGHIKLSDFGLAKISDKLYDSNKDSFINNNLKEKENEIKKHEKSYSCVGTAYYVAPEVLMKKGYGKEIDWWSVGVIFFEMLVGYAPFCSKETSEVCNKILNWKKYLRIPSKTIISPEAEDLIAKLINNSNIRLGLNGAEEIKRHPFFRGLDWDNIRNLKAPFIPELENEYDTHYFDHFKIKEPFYPQEKKKKRKDIEYLGFTYKDDPRNNIDILNEFQIAIQKLGDGKKETKTKNIIVTPKDTFAACTQCETISSKDNNKYLNNKSISKEKIKNYLELDAKTEPNFVDNKNKNNKIIIGLENFLSTNPSIKNNSKSKNNNIVIFNKTTQNIAKSNKNTDGKEIKLNIIQLPNKKLSKNIGIKNHKNKNNLVNNQLKAINNSLPKNNYKIINNKVINNIKSNSQKKSINSLGKSIKKANNSYSKKKPIKLSPSPQQKNIFLRNCIDKSKSKQKEIRCVSGDNGRNINYPRNNFIKKSISQNTIKKIISNSKNKNKNISRKKVNNNNNDLGKKIIFNNKNIKKSINIVPIRKQNGIINTCQKNKNPSTRIAYIYKKKNE